MKIKEYIDNRILEEIKLRLNEKDKEDKKEEKIEKEEEKLNPQKYQNNVYELYMLLKNYQNRLNIDITSAKYMLGVIDHLIERVQKNGSMNKSEMNLINKRIDQVI